MVTYTSIGQVDPAYWLFIENSQNCYKPGANITIDEQLSPIKARCRFTQYLPNKPDKFGIKFWLAPDVQTKYILNGFPCLEKNENRAPSQLLGEFVVLKLIEPYSMMGRTITTDNCFTSLSLAYKLLAKRTTLVGIIRGNRRELPKICKTKKDTMARFSSLLYRSNEITLAIYKSKPRKKVFIPSSKHKTVKIGKSEKGLPETVEFCNKTKFEVYIADQMAKKYSVKSGSRRWPLQVFFNILDLASIDAWILYKETTGEQISRKEFMFQLADELAADNEKSRVEQRASEIQKRCQKNSNLMKE
ncbi:piggyBac transposable element-derived protein 4-like [Bombus pyrosoma]|uniref:piggyBac transposable element-derived protein 4-like n=1 Tax=Bombus pyrosoma TaxID=396416 RepID=UPI001CB93C57|nr:piggyBac transposable element-derived protein 4-like [Bombus pyrosoma]